MLRQINVWVCDTCFDTPQIQLRTIILPPDPVPVYLPFPEPFDTEVPSNMTTVSGSWLTTISGSPLVMMSKITPSPNPDDPVLFPADF